MTDPPSKPSTPAPETVARSVAGEALELSRTGDVAGALALLRAARENAPLDESALSLLFKLLQDRGVDDEVIGVCDEGLAAARRPVQRSSWHLRRGLLFIEGRNRDAAVKDLLAVLKLKASEDHTAQAQKGLLAAAQLPKAH